MHLPDHLRATAAQENGQDLIEYALMVLLLAIVAFASLQAVGGWVLSEFLRAVANLPA